MEIDVHVVDAIEGNIASAGYRLIADNFNAIEALSQLIEFTGKIGVQRTFDSPGLAIDQGHGQGHVRSDAAHGRADT